MTPLVRRSWAPRGKTPLLYQRTRSRQKVSAIAALTVSPRRRRVGLYFSLVPNENIDSRKVQDFLRELRRHIQNPIILIWDRLNAHRSVRVQSWMARCHGLSSEFLPAYAPELNPVENLWSYLKQNPLANFAAADVDELFRTTKRATRKIGARPDLLRSFIKGVPLFLRFK